MHGQGKGYLIKSVEPGSIAAEVGLVPGDRLLRVNGFAIQDIIDYRYQISSDTVVLLVEKDGGRRWEIEIEKDEDTGLGITFEHYTLDPPRLCRNKCIFCFVDQLPKGMRLPLYVKDDDYRLSFMEGNYITLTNLREDDYRRIENYRLSPLYISIHATNPKVRQHMINHPEAGKIMQSLRRLATAGIQMHGQVVLCPGINDGKVLDRTVEDLAILWPSLQTVAVVPVGLTRYRNGLFPINRPTPQWARAVVEQVSVWQKKFFAKWGSRFFFLADEFYLLAGLSLPSAEEYEDYSQIENGVGLVRQFLTQYIAWRRSLPQSARSLSFSIVTGRSAGVLLHAVINDLKRIKGLSPRLHVLPSIFWGENVTVAGLLTGTDLLHGLKDREVGEMVIIPRIMLKENSEVFLDDLTCQEVTEELGVPVVPVQDLQELGKVIFSDNPFEWRSGSVQLTGSNSRKAQCGKIYLV